MTINVSVRVPDGIVLASDSLASSFKPVQANIQLQPFDCAKCGAKIKPGPMQAPVGVLPGSSTPLASKLFYVGNYGVTFFGAAAINGRSIFNHVMMFRTKSFDPKDGLAGIASTLAGQLQEAVLADPMIKQAPPGTPIVGFQACGYDEADIDVGQTSVVTLIAGKDPTIKEQKREFGVTVTGQQEVAKKLFANLPGGISAQPNFTTMTLPDAIDYAKFLVQTTSDYQRFADMVPNVGGPVEVALITKWIGFRFVQRKKLLGEETTRLNIGKIHHELTTMRRDLPSIVQDALQLADENDDVAIS